MTVAHRRKRAPRTHGNGSERVAEIIGRSTANNFARLYSSRGVVVSVDDTIPDYAFYDMLRRGKQSGYKLGALFAKRIEHIFAVWVLGRGVTVTLAEAGDDDNPDDPRNVTNQALKDFFDAVHAQLMTVKEDTLGLGVQYIFVNPDGTLSVPSPDTVEVERDPFDYRTVLQATITTKLPSYTVTDVYTPTERVITWRKGTETVRVERYANLIGRLPYIQLDHGKSGNETHGHSIHEDLLKLYDQYDDVIHKQLDGAKLLGNPILAISGLEDLTAVIDANKPMVNSTYSDRDGIEVTRPELNVDSNSVLLIGKGGNAYFVAPPTGFSADTQQSLKTLFLLLLDRTGIPEFIWGNELSGSHATAETQLMQWAHDIEGMQRADETWLLELCDIWLAWRSLTDPAIVVDALKAEWPPVLDENQELRLKLLEFASGQNLLTAKTKLKLTSLPVGNVDDEIEGGADEAQARQADDLARLQAQAATMPATPVGEMSSHGYNEREAAAIVQAAARQLAGG
jgi:hypothetical protein